MIKSHEELQLTKRSLEQKCFGCFLSADSRQIVWWLHTLREREGSHRSAGLSNIGCDGYNRRTSIRLSLSTVDSTLRCGSSAQVTLTKTHAAGGNTRSSTPLHSTALDRVAWINFHVSRAGCSFTFPRRLPGLWAGIQGPRTRSLAAPGYKIRQNTQVSDVNHGATSSCVH